MKGLDRMVSEGCFHILAVLIRKKDDVIRSFLHDLMEFDFASDGTQPLAARPTGTQAWIRPAERISPPVIAILPGKVGIFGCFCVFTSALSCTDENDLIRTLQEAENPFLSISLSIFLSLSFVHSFIHVCYILLATSYVFHFRAKFFRFQDK